MEFIIFTFFMVTGLMWWYYQLLRLIDYVFKRLRDKEDKEE